MGVEAVSFTDTNSNITKCSRNSFWKGILSGNSSIVSRKQLHGNITVAYRSPRKRFAIYIPLKRFNYTGLICEL